jgi:hypothetical protein
MSHSPHSLHLEQIRALRLERIRRQIQTGEYETPEKLEFALSRLFAAVGIDQEVDVREWNFGSRDE